MRAADARPIEAAVDVVEGVLAIELKVPLAFSVSAPHAVEASPGSTISLGLETAPPKVRRNPSGERGGGGGRGGFGMGGGGMGGRGGGMRGGGGSGRSGRSGRGEARSGEDAKAYGKTLKAWLSVSLAREANQTER